MFNLLNQLLVVRRLQLKKRVLDIILQFLSQIIQKPQHHKKHMENLVKNDDYQYIIHFLGIMCNQNIEQVPKK